jgi:hypothetical protein
MLPAPTPQARALVPEDVAARRLVIPLAVEDDRLVLAVSEPLGADVIEELSFALGVRIDERIAPSVRIREALARVYAVPLERRMARLVGRLAGVDPTVPNSLPPLSGPRPANAPLVGALVHDIPRLNPPGMPVLGSLHFPDSRGSLEEKKPPPRTSSSADVKAVLPQLLRESKGTPDATRRRGPVTMQQVTDELAEIKDRESLLRLFFDFARQFFEYSALFVAHGDIAEGRDAFGTGSPRERVLALGVPLDIPSILRTARERAAPVCAYPAAGGLDGVLMGDLKRDVRFQVLVVPIVVRSRVVAFFVADNGSTGVDPASQGEVIAVAALVGREFERLIVRIKLQGFTGEAAVQERRVDPRRVAAKPRRSGPEAREAAVAALEQVIAASVAPPAPAENAPPITQPLLPTPVSERPGAFRRSSIPGPAPVPAPVVDEPMPRTSKTLPGFQSPTAEEIAEVTEKVPPVTFAEPHVPPPAAPIDPAPVDTLDSGFEPLSERARALAGEFTPPPPQAAAVHRPSGPPIPREETGEEASSVLVPRVERISSRPPPADLRQARLLREIDALTASFVHAPPSSRGGPPPSSARGGQAVTVPPHRPPSSRLMEEALPSVIVDEAVKIDRLAASFVANPSDERAEAELLRLGQLAMPSIMKHFPGPITITRATLDDSWPRVSECGPILRLIAGQRRVALPFVLARIDDPETETRFWATYLLTELPYAEAIPAVVGRLFDDSKRVRRAARLVAHVLGQTVAAPLVAELDRIVRDPKASSGRRVVTLDALGEMRDALVVPVLFGVLADEDEDVGLAARKALLLVTRQDFGRDTKKWLAWWQANASRHRVEWLIDALTHDVPAHRRAAGQELKAVTEQYFGYYDDLPRKDRERAQQKYREWWKSEGVARFRRG